jgi:hypothetical protein
MTTRYQRTVFVRFVILSCASNVRTALAKQEESDPMRAANTASFTVYRDRIIRLYGGGLVAVASTYVYTTVIAPPGVEFDPGSSVEPHAMTVVLVKEAAEWKVAHVHLSKLEPMRSVTT